MIALVPPLGGPWEEGEEAPGLHPDALLCSGSEFDRFIQHLLVRRAGPAQPEAGGPFKFPSNKVHAAGISPPGAGLGGLCTSAPGVTLALSER